MRAALGRGVVVSLSIAVAALASCSGGSGGDSPSAPSCSRPAVSTTGPGDALDYFPNEVGWSWTYYGAETGSVTWTVTGTVAVGNETASVWSTGELVVERPSGAYALSDATVEPPLDQLYPLLLLPFPVATTAAADQGECTSISVGDSDGDGKGDTVDMVATMQVLSVTETAQVMAGSFTDVVHVQQVMHVTNHLSALGTVAETITQDDWFAPGLGLVVRRLEDSAPPYFDDVASFQLASFTRPPLPAATAVDGAERAQAPAGAAPPIALASPLRAIADRAR